MGLRGLPRGARSHPRRRLTGCRLCGNIALAAAAALFRDSSILRATSNLNSAEEREAAQQQAGARGTRDARPGRDGCGPSPSGPHRQRLGPGLASLRSGGARTYGGPPPGAPGALPSPARECGRAVCLLPASAAAQVAPWLKTHADSQPRALRLGSGGHPPPRRCVPGSPAACPPALQSLRRGARGPGRVTPVCALPPVRG